MTMKHLLDIGIYTEENVQTRSSRSANNIDAKYRFRKFQVDILKIVYSTEKSGQNNL